MKRLAGIFLAIGLICVLAGPSFCSAEEKVNKIEDKAQLFLLFSNQSARTLDLGATLSELTSELDSGEIITNLISKPVSAPPWRRLDGTAGLYPHNTPYPNPTDASQDLAVIYRAATWLSALRVTSRQMDGHGIVSELAPQLWALLPATGGVLGPIYIDGKLIHYVGSLQWSPLLTPEAEGKSTQGFNAFARATYKAGPAYLGATFALLRQEALSGPPSDGIFSGSNNIKPVLIFLNAEHSRSLGEIIQTGGAGSFSTSVYGGDSAWNMFLHQSFIGWKMNPRLNLNLTFSLARLDQKLNGSLSDEIGRELDFTATYRILDNLNFMAAFGYLWSGDALKNATPGSTLSNDWLLMHRLTLNF